MNKPQSQPAYSLIFAFIIVTVMMLLAVTTIGETNDKIAFYSDLEGGTQAYLAGQSAAEDAVVAMKDYGPGYEPTSTSNAFSEDTNGDGTVDTHGDYEVFALAQHNDNDASGLRYLPIPGTGSAGNPDDCSVLDTTDKAVADDCNWNKMLYGQNVTIPLYVDDGSGTLQFPYQLEMTSWSLKVRTPCVDPTEDSTTCARYELDTTASGFNGTFGYDDSVILWQISGRGTDGSGADVDVTVVPDDRPASGSRGSVIRDPSVNTEIYESQVNTSSDNIVLQAINTDPYKDIFNACMGDSDADGTPDLTLSTLSLQMDIVAPLKQLSPAANIPYLEWQFAINSTKPFADTKSVVVGKGYHQGTDHTFYYPYVVTRSTTGESTNVYTLSN